VASKVETEEQPGRRLLQALQQQLVLVLLVLVLLSWPSFLLASSSLKQMHRQRQGISTMMLPRGTTAKRS